MKDQDHNQLEIELLKLLEQCRDLAAEGVANTDRYFRDKYGMDKELAEIDAAIKHIKDSKG